MDPIVAVTHPDPYPYYADLVGARPFARDDKLGLWVASSAGAVTAVLNDRACLVRPPAERVPRALDGTPGGAIFGRLVRMTDGVKHSALKPPIAAVIAGVESAVAEPARRWAEHLARELDPASDPSRVNDFAFALSTYVLASLLGVAPERLAETAAGVGDFARGIAPGATSAELARGGAAARRLLDTFARLRETRSAGLLGNLDREITRGDHGDADDVVANGIGFLSQAYEATAGLIGNTLVALAREKAARTRAAEHLNAIVREVVRHDAPVQNTRRFVAADTVVGGQPLRAGDVVLVVLAAANRDPLANPEPGSFDLFRATRRVFTFGIGPHACPGEVIAVTIAEAAARQLLSCGVEPERLVDRMTYRPSANVRIPDFGRGSYLRDAD